MRMNTASAALLDQIESEIEAWQSQIERGLAGSAERLGLARESLMALPPRNQAPGCARTAACAAGLKAAFSGYSEAVYAQADQLTELTAGLRDLFRDLKARDYAGIDAIRTTFARLDVALPAEVPADGFQTRNAPPRLQAFDGYGNRRLMGEILVEAGILTGDELADALSEQASAPHRRLGAILMQRGYATGHIVARVVASQLQMPFVDLEDYPVKYEAVHLVGKRTAELHRAIPIDSSATEIIVAMTNPLDMVATEDIEQATGRRVIAVVAAVEDVTAAIEAFYKQA